MKIIDFSREHARPIELFDAVSASNIRVGHGRGECYVYAVHFGPHGSIGEHPAGFGQLFLIVEGQGWVAGAEGVKVPLVAGQGAYFASGEIHSKGSEVGMTALMVQADSLEASFDE